MPKTQDELLVRRILWLQAKHPLASMVPLELSMCGGGRYLRFTLARCKDSHYDLYKFFDDDYLNRETDCEEEDLALSGLEGQDAKLGVVFIKPLPWVTRLRLPLGSEPPFGLRDDVHFDDEVYAAPRWDYVCPVPQHRQPLQG